MVTIRSSMMMMIMFLAATLSYVIIYNLWAINENYRFTVLEHCSPFNLDLNEHKWIQRLKCIKPFGLNSHDPFGIPLVLQNFYTAHFLDFYCSLSLVFQLLSRFYGFYLSWHFSLAFSVFILDLPFYQSKPTPVTVQPVSFSFLAMHTYCTDNSFIYLYCFYHCPLYVF